MKGLFSVANYPLVSVILTKSRIFFSQFHVVVTGQWEVACQTRSQWTFHKRRILGRSVSLRPAVVLTYNADTGAHRSPYRVIFMWDEG